MSCVTPLCHKLGAHSPVAIDISFPALICWNLRVNEADNPIFWHGRDGASFAVRSLVGSLFLSSHPPRLAREKWINDDPPASRSGNPEYVLSKGPRRECQIFVLWPQFIIFLLLWLSRSPSVAGWPGVVRYRKIIKKN